MSDANGPYGRPGAHRHHVGEPWFMFSTLLASVWQPSALFHALVQCFPNCVPRHTGVQLKKLKCAAKVLCFDKTFCMLHHFRYKVVKSRFL